MFVRVNGGVGHRASEGNLKKGCDENLSERESEGDAYIGIVVVIIVQRVSQYWQVRVHLPFSFGASLGVFGPHVAIAYPPLPHLLSLFHR